MTMLDAARTHYTLDDVRAERARQDGKWGEQNHNPFTWLTILSEEVGETAQEALRAHFGSEEPADLDRYLSAYRAEMIQVAAVAVAAVECLDRATLTES